jgi:hypothetical protein
MLSVSWADAHIPHHHSFHSKQNSILYPMAVLQPDMPTLLDATLCYATSSDATVHQNFICGNTCLLYWSKHEIHLPMTTGSGIQLAGNRAKCVPWSLTSGPAARVLHAFSCSHVWQSGTLLTGIAYTNKYCCWRSCGSSDPQLTIHGKHKSLGSGGKSDVLTSWLKRFVTMIFPKELNLLVGYTGRWPLVDPPRSSRSTRCSKNKISIGDWLTIRIIMPRNLA